MCRLDNLIDFFSHWKSLCKIAGWQDYYAWFLPRFCWSIWKERNNKIFRDREEPTKILGRKILKNIKENLQLKEEGEADIGDRKKVKVKDKDLKR